MKRWESFQGNKKKLVIIKQKYLIINSGSAFNGNLSILNREFLFLFFKFIFFLIIISLNFLHE